MTLIARAVLLAAGLTLAQAASADTTLDTRAFTLTHEGDFAFPTMAVLSDQDGTIQIGFKGLQPDAVTALDEGHYPWYTSAMSTSFIDTSVKTGYRIASMTLRGSVTGTPLPAVPTRCGQAGYSCVPGVATSAATLSWSTYVGDASTQHGNLQWNNLNGTEAFALTADAPRTGAFSLYFDLYNTVFAQAGLDTYEGNTYSSFYASSSSFAFSDLTLTVQVVAVPEPATYAMLLGGLGFMGLTARRRRTAPRG